MGRDCSLPAGAERSGRAGRSVNGARPATVFFLRVDELIRRTRFDELIHLLRASSREAVGVRLRGSRGFHVGAHQRRYRDHECVPRTYKGDAARFTSWYYSLEATFHEYLMRSAHRTTDPAEADFFYAPAYVACYHLKYNHPSPRQTTETLPEPKVRPHGALIRWRALASYLRERLTVPELPPRARREVSRRPLGTTERSRWTSPITPSWRIDEGAARDAEELKTATFLTHWNTGVPHDESTTGFGNDDWSGLVRAGSSGGGGGADA